MPRVELLFFPGCPHVGAARTQLKRALGTAGLPVEWAEIDVLAPDAPPEVRGFGSPTVLVDGRDVAPAPAPEGAACRLYLGSDTPGAPPLAALVEALRHGA